MIGADLIRRVRKEREVIALFMEQGACTPNLAVKLATLDPQWVRYRPELNRFLARGVVQRASENEYYLDENRLLQIRMNRIKWGLVGLLAVCLLVLAWLSGKR